MTKKQQRQLDWLMSNKEFIKVRQVEIAIGMPEGTLKKYVDNRRELPVHWIVPLCSWIADFITC